MPTPAEEYRAFLREVIDVTRHSTHAVEECRKVLQECRERLDVLAKAATEDANARRQSAQTKIKSIEVCKSIVTSPWFAAMVPTMITWGMLVLAYVFGLPVPVPALPVSDPAEVRPHE